MNPSPGSRLDHYEIIELMGKGGMGEVYRAKDTRLPRDAAIKISAQQFSDRFTREAKIVASLNHPNICTLYDVGPNYLVMELIEGPTLAARLKGGPMSLEEASRIARQIADALDNAHEKGVVHRDLKPGNIKIRPDGVVKVLDFGLAKSGGMPIAQSDESPTVTVGQTAAGVILGTAAYMAPEQAKGKEVDKRADIYAFGLVFYEMLSGVRVHAADTLQETMASVLKDEPDLSKVPIQAHRLLKRCLEKDPQKRLRHIGDVMSLLDDTPSSSGVTSIVGPPSVSTTSARKWLWSAVAAAGLAIVASGVAYWAPWRDASNPPPVRFEVNSTDKVKFLPSMPSPSPDGKWMVLPARGEDGVLRYYIRSLDSIELRPLPGTETPNGFSPPPFWSADSRSIAFPVNPSPFQPGQLKKIDISGGPPQVICDTPAAANSGAWNREGLILFGSGVNTGIRKVNAAGGVSTEITVLDPARKERAHQYPQFLPDGKHFLYQRVSLSPEFTGMYVGSLDAKPGEQSTKPLLVIDRQARYLAPMGRGPARLLFQRDATLFAQAFDDKRMELLGDAVPVADQLGALPQASAGFFEPSATTLIYRVGIGGGLARLTWLEAGGTTTPISAEPAAYLQPVVSPDTSRAAVSVFDPQRATSNIWILDLKRGSGTRLTFNAGRDNAPIWSPDGKRIAFASNRSGAFDLYVKAADGSGDDELLLKSDQDKRPWSWSKDGRYLLYVSMDLKSLEDLWILPMEGDRKPIPFLRTEFRERTGAFSPDGRWIAYTSNESGADEIYVRPFSPGAVGNSGGKWMVSKGGGVNPRWRVDGKELYYVSQTSLMAVEVTTGAAVQPGVPRRLFSGESLNNWFDVSTDGRFLLVSQGTNLQSPITVVLNWQSALK